MEILNPIQLEVLKAASTNKLPQTFTVAWAVNAVAYLGGLSQISSSDFHWDVARLVRITRPL